MDLLSSVTETEDNLEVDGLSNKALSLLYQAFEKYSTSRRNVIHAPKIMKTANVY